MAITPRTFVRNPLLLLFFTTLSVGALALMFPCQSQSRCGLAKKAPVVKQVAVQKVNMATIEAAKTSGFGWLGVEIQTLTTERAEFAGVNAKHGVLVLGLQADRPAQAAGFKPYDVIVRFNGKPMRSACQLKKTVASTAPGTKVPVEVMRGDKRFILRPILVDKQGVRGCGAACK